MTEGWTNSQDSYRPFKFRVLLFWELWWVITSDKRIIRKNLIQLWYRPPFPLPLLISWTWRRNQRESLQLTEQENKYEDHISRGKLHSFCVETKCKNTDFLLTFHLPRMIWWEQIIITAITRIWSHHLISQLKNWLFPSIILTCLDNEGWRGELGKGRNYFIM